MEKQHNKPIKKFAAVKGNTGGYSMVNWMVILALVLPVLFSNTTLDPVIAIRYLCLSFFILLFIIFFHAANRNSVSIILYPLTKLIFIIGLSYGLWSIICLAFAFDKGTTTYETGRYFLNFIFLFWVIIAVQQEQIRILQLCKALTLTAIIQSAIAILQFYDLAFMNIPGTEKPYGLMVHRTLFGSAQALLLPFSSFVLYKGENKWKITSIISLIGIVFSLIISQSRSAWLAAISFIVVTFILTISFGRINRRKWIFGILIGMLSTTILVSIVITLSKGNAFSTALKQKALTLTTKTDNFNAISTGRLELWSKTVQLIKDHYLFGVGPGNWNIAIINYSSEGSSWAYGEKVPSRPHNIYLQVASETGIPGALINLIF